MTNEQWGQVRASLKDQIGQSNYKNWIEPLEFMAYDDGVVTFGAPTRFLSKYVTQKYGEQIIFHLGRAGQPVSRLTFEITNAPTKAAASAQNAVKPLPENTFTFDPRFTFERFVVGKPNEMAHAAARRVAAGEEVDFNPLVLYGGSGLGKTHLMHAIAHERLAHDPDARIIYISAEQFMFRFITALRDKKMIDFKDLFRSADILMIDDFQFMAGKDSTQEEFFHTFNALIEEGKQIIVSADRLPGEIRDLQERIISRMQSGLTVDVHPTSYELRLSILQSKVRSYQAKTPGFSVEDGVLELVARRISSNVRELEGALTRLFAFHSLVGQVIDVEQAQDCLADLIRNSQRKITIEEIQRKVADHYTIRMSDLIGPKRQRIYARPRQIAMYLCKTLTSRSFPEIGRKFGGKDHTTILHGVRKIEELMALDGQIADDVELLRRAIEH